MKVNLEKEEEEKYELHFPCLLEGINSGIVVLMIQPEYGTVLKGSTFPTGSIIHNWDMTCFKPFKGKITLEND